MNNNIINFSNNVLIVGRTNVGKSTLFNRLSERVKSIALEKEGVTRDFLKDEIKWKDKVFNIIDSGGLEFSKKDDRFQKLISNQVINLINQSSVIIFMVDGKTGPLIEDLEIAKLLHKLNKKSFDLDDNISKKIILTVNKNDVKEAQDNFYQFNKLGFDNIIAISSQHGTGISELLDKVVKLLPKVKLKENQDPKFKVSFIGKPNVGKSSLMNLLLKQERALVSDLPGTTREAISENIVFCKETIELTDTPGIRRKKVVTDELETLMVKSSFNALKSSDIIILLIDAEFGQLVDQELKLAFYSFEKQYKALILIINKSDLFTEKSRSELKNSLKYYEHLIKNIIILEVSCKTGKNVGKIMPIIKETFDRYSRRYTSTELTRLLVDGLIRKPLYHKKQLLKIFKANQVKVAPITIELTVNNHLWFEDAQLGYLENILRKEYDLLSVPIKFLLKKAK